MQTSFSLAQLADPHIAEADKILRACVHCGFCTATCPTYVLLGDERDSPRGRIYLIKDMLENDRPATADVVTHIDRCLSCLACMTTCPSGVHYMHLVDHARVHIEQTYRRPLLDRLIRAFLARVMPYPHAVALGRSGGGACAAARAAVRRRGAEAAGRRAPALRRAARPDRSRPPARIRRRDRAAARVALLAGCANEALAPSITQATIRLLNRHGVEVVIAAGEACCGSLEHHMGREAGALAKARANVDAWTREIEGEGLDAILVTISGCGTTVKDYGFMLRTDPAYAAKAAKVSALARDVSEYLAELGLRRRRSGRRSPSPITPPARSSTASRCTASRRTCSRLVGSWSRRCRRRICAAARPAPTTFCSRRSPGDCATARSGNIEKTAPDVIAAGNIGCITQIASGTAIPVVHPVELIDWATGGPVPERLRERVGE